MPTDAMPAALRPSYDIFRLNTRLFSNVLEGVTPELATQRLTDSTNSLVWMAGHLLSTRYLICQLLGNAVKDPYASYFGKGAAIRNMEYPNIGELLANWEEHSADLLSCLQKQDAAALEAPSPSRYPVSDDTMAGMLAFFAQHESYHLGQMAFLRKALGLPAMQYN